MNKYSALILFFCLAFVTVAYADIVEEVQKPLISIGDEIEGRISLDDFFRSLDISSQGEYKNIITGLKHGPDRVAPPLLRSFVESLRPVRMSFNSGVTYKNDKLTLWWFFPEFALEGEPQSCISQINSLMSGKGYSVKDPAGNQYGQKEYNFTKDAGTFSYHLMIEGMQRYKGGKKVLSGGTLTFEINCSKPVRRPSVADILKIYPELKCPELPPVLYDQFKDKMFSSISYGGTWTQYYDWDMTVPVEKEKQEAALQQLEKIILSLGFELDKTEKNIRTYRGNGQSPPYIYLGPENNDALNFRYQPHS